MILLWGLPGDRALSMVGNSLLRLKQPFILLDQRDILHTRITLSVDSKIEGELSVRDHCIPLSAITAMYLRPYDSRQLPFIAQAGEGSQAWLHALEVDDILLSWVELTPALVVNRPSAMATNSSKPYQATRIKACGFRIPDTLITTDPQAVRDFWESHEAIIYKSVSGVRSIVSRLETKHLKRIKHVQWCPTQFQEYISGSDYRVHIIHDEVYSCKISSAADDYRYADRQGSSATLESCPLPEPIITRCRTLAASLNLTVVGIDLRHTNEDQWYCFEVNPSPGFPFFQSATNQPIDMAIAKLLARCEQT